MRFYRGNHRYYCGIDLHARTMYLCLTDDRGTTLLHESLPCKPAAFLAAVQPCMDDLVVTAECIFCWYWLADLCQQHSIKFVLAHALYLKAIHGGKTKKIASTPRSSPCCSAAASFPRLTSTHPSCGRPGTCSAGASTSRANGPSC